MRSMNNHEFDPDRQFVIVRNVRMGGIDYTAGQSFPKQICRAVSCGSCTINVWSTWNHHTSRPTARRRSSTACHGRIAGS